MIKGMFTWRILHVRDRKMDPIYKFIAIKSTSALNLFFFIICNLFISIINQRAFLHYRSNLDLDLDIYL